MIIDNQAFNEYHAFVEQELHKQLKIYGKDEVVFITGSPSDRIKKVLWYASDLSYMTNF